MADVLDSTADAMEKLVKGRKTEVHMGRVDIQNKHDHLCGSPACVGGWLGILYGKENCHWSCGADMFAEKLGFVWGYHIPSPQWCLRRFFHERPELWGNEKGSEMFHNPLAYRDGPAE